MVVAALLVFFAGVTGMAQAASSRAVQGVVFYTTRRGDSLYRIAGHYLHRLDDWTAVARLNHLSAPWQIQSGRKLRLPVALLKQATLSVKIRAVNGPVSYAHHGAAFTPLTTSVKLVEGDRVKTGDNGFATFELPPDHSWLVMSPNSLLKVSALRQTVLTGTVDRVLNLQQGKVESEVTPARKENDHFQIHSPSVTAGVRGTHFQIHSASDGTTDIEVLKGAVAVDGVDKSVSAQRRSHELVTALHGNVTRANGRVDTPRALLPAPELTGPSRVQDGAGASFDIKPVKGARYYHVQICRDAGLLDRIHDTSASITHVVIGPLPDGDYFMRVSAIDADGLEGVPGIYPFRWRGMDVSASRP